MIPCRSVWQHRNEQLLDHVLIIVPCYGLVVMIVTWNCDYSSSYTVVLKFQVTGVQIIAVWISEYPGVPWWLEATEWFELF